MTLEPERDPELLGCFWELHAAVVRRDGIEARLRAGQHDPELLTRSLPAAEAVIAARTALYRHLMQQGWTPPNAVVRDLAYDETVLAYDEAVLALADELTD
jgi:hypothetical protein